MTFAAPRTSAEAAAYNPSEASAEARYQFLEQYKNAALSDATIYAALTLPYLISSSRDWLRTNKTGFKLHQAPRGAMSGLCVSTLAAKLAAIQFPSSKNFYSVKPSSRLRFRGPNNEEIALDDKQRKLLDQFLLRVRDAMLDDLYKRSIPQVYEECERHSLVTGMGLMHYPPGRKARSFRMDQYVFNADGHWNLIELIVKQVVNWYALDKRIREAILEKRQRPESELAKDDYKIFTCLRREEDTDNNEDTANYVEYQEVDGIEVPGSRTEYGPKRKKKSPPWLLLPWRRVADGLWPMSLVGERFALHASHEGLSYTQQILAGMAADRKRLVKPGVTDIDELREADPGSYVRGDPEDVADTTLGDISDVRWIQEMNLNVIGLMTRSYGMYDEKPVDRRTAYESSLLARELNANNQGVVSLHSELGQKPILNALLDEAIDNEDLFPGDLKQLRGAIQPYVVGGLEAMGQEDDVSAWGKMLALVANAEQSGLTRYTNKGILYKEFARISGVDVNGIIFDDDMIAQIDARAQAAQFLQPAVGPTARNLTAPSGAGSAA